MSDRKGRSSSCDGATDQEVRKKDGGKRTGKAYGKEAYWIVQEKT